MDEAKAIYLSDYWNRHHIDRMPQLSRFDVFDGVVNSRAGVQAVHQDRAIRWVQQALELWMTA